MTRTDAAKIKPGDVIYSPHYNKQGKEKIYFYADCDERDDCMTGWHASPQEAIDSFLLENTFTASEERRVNVYVRKIVDPTVEDLAEQAELAKKLGLICATRGQSPWS